MSRNEPGRKAIRLRPEQVTIGSAGPATPPPSPSAPTRTDAMATQSPSQNCCPEGARLALSRRGLILGGLGAAAAASVVFGDAVVTTSPARAAAAVGAPVLLVLSMRGAADGLSLVVPHGDPVYYASRPRLAIPKERLLAADTMFGLHPALEPLLPLWEGGRLAAVHATGLPAPNRSHFEAMELLETADPGSAARIGWLNRLIGTDSDANPLQGLQMGASVTPTSLYGPQPTVAASRVDRVEIPASWDGDGGVRRTSLQTLWRHERSPLARAAMSTFTLVDTFSAVADQPETTQTYPQSDLGEALSHAARVIKAGIGVQVINVDQGNWDTHVGQGNLDWGDLKGNAESLASSIAAFFADLGPVGDNVTLVALSEFGRRTVENAQWGTDHGYGNVMFVAGAGVKGGRYYGQWPGLAAGPDADLLVTTDYRSVLGELVSARFNVDPVAVFPNFTRSPVGVFG